LQNQKQEKVHVWRNRVGNRPPKDYQLFIRTKIEKPVVKRAIDHVFERIGRHFYGDALRLEERVGIILPLRKRAKGCCGRWIPFPPSYRRYKKGIILLKEDMDFNLACVVFAHECGHAVSRNEYMEYASEGFYQHAIHEAAANYYVDRWGFDEQLENARNKLRIIAGQDLDRLISNNSTTLD
jgi:hypothetical protein